MATATATEQRRAIGIVRVSQVNGRDGDSFASPQEQRERVEAACQRDDLLLIETLTELDVSGGTPLHQRTGLCHAVEAVEHGDADVIVAAYFDRLVRSLRVQDELVSRVEAAGGQVLAVDVGRVTNGTAGQWLSGTMLGAVSEYQRRTVAERSREAQVRAVERGVLPYPNVPPGYVRGDDGRLVPDPDIAPVVAEAFRLRANGATVAEVRAFLAERGIERTYHGVQSLLTSPVVLGQISFGDLHNPSAHPAIVDTVTWQRVQRIRSPRGRRSKSDRLLARLGVLRCGTCGSRMVVGSSNHGAYPVYRCPPTGDCRRRVTISAELVEGIVTRAVREALSDAEGRASAEKGRREAERVAEQAQEVLDNAIRAFAGAGIDGEPTAVEQLGELREARDAAREHVEQLGGDRTDAVVVNAGADWDRLTLDERRALIRAVVAGVTVAAGRGAGRVSVQLVGE